MDEAPPIGFLVAPADTPEGQRLFDGDLDGQGYIANVTRLWAYEPAMLSGLSDLMARSAEAGALTFRQRAVLVTATASTLGDSYCSLAWGRKLADAAGPEVAAGVLRGEDQGLDPTERALAQWARGVARDPNAIDAPDVDALRQAGFSDAQIFAITTYVAMRLAFSIVNDALGVRPDHRLGELLPDDVLGAVTYGRAIADS